MPRVNELDTPSKVMSAGVLGLYRALDITTSSFTNSPSKLIR